MDPDIVINASEMQGLPKPKMPQKGQLPLILNEGLLTNCSFSINTFDLMLLEVNSGYDIPEGEEYHFREKESNSDRKTRVLALLEGKEDSELNLDLYKSIQKSFNEMEEHGVEVKSEDGLTDYLFLATCTCYRNDGKMNGILCGRRGPCCPSCITGPEVWNDFDRQEEEGLTVSLSVIHISISFFSSFKPLNFDTMKEDYEAVPKKANGKPKVHKEDWRTRKGFTQEPQTEAPLSNFTVLHKVRLKQI